MYKVGDKFIIEIDSVMTNKKGALYGIKGFNSLVFDEKGLDRLTNYEDGFIVAFSDAMNKGYNKGLSDAWEYAKKFYSYNFDQIKEIFGENRLNKINDDYTAQEIIEKIKAFEQKQEIKVGDVVEVDGIGTFVITYIVNENLYDCLKLGTLSGYTITDKSVVKKTGKHIDLTEIFKVLEGEDANSSNDTKSTK